MTSSSPSDESAEKKKELASPEKKEETTPTTPAPVVRRLKYEMCKNWRERGECKYGDKCLFAHGDAELTKRVTAPPPVVEKKPEPKDSASKTDPAEESKIELTEPRAQEMTNTEKLTPKFAFETEPKT